MVLSYQISSNTRFFTMRGLLLSLLNEFNVFILISSLHPDGASELFTHKHNVKPRKADLEGVYEYVVLPEGIDKMPEEPCCGDVKFSFNAMMDEMEECKEERDADGKDDDVHCIMECVAKKLNLLDSKGFLKADKITEFVPGLVEGDPRLEEMMKSFTRGTLSAVNNMAKAMKAENAIAECNFVLQLYMRFVFNLLILNCPEEMQNNNGECYKVRKIVLHNNRA